MAGLQAVEGDLTRLHFVYVLRVILGYRFIIDRSYSSGFAYYRTHRIPASGSRRVKFVVTKREQFGTVVLETHLGSVPETAAEIYDSGSLQDLLNRNGTAAKAQF